MTNQQNNGGQAEEKKDVEEGQVEGQQPVGQQNTTG
jgi:hypothetical protein